MFLSHSHVVSVNQASGRSRISLGGGGGGGADVQCRRFLVKTYAKTKELGPVGGRAPGAPPGSATASLWMDTEYILHK